MGRCGDVSDYAVEQVRDLVLQLAELDADYMRNNGSIQDQNSKNLYTYAMTTRKSALMARELPQILEHYRNLTPIEIGLLASQFLVVGDGDRAKAMFDTATKEAQATKSPTVLSEMYRMSARQFIVGSPLGTDIGKARDAYQNAWQVLKPEPQRRFAVQAYAVLVDWSALEAYSGDRACGLELAKIAMPVLQAINLQLSQPPRHSLIRSIRHRRENVLTKRNFEGTRSGVGTFWPTASRVFQISVRSMDFDSGQSLCFPKLCKEDKDGSDFSGPALSLLQTTPISRGS